MTATDSHSPTCIDRLIDEWLQANGDRAWPISVAAVVKSLRNMLVAADLSDRDLADEVARRAIANSYDVEFDMPNAV